MLLCLAHPLLGILWGLAIKGLAAVTRLWGICHERFAGADKILYKASGPSQVLTLSSQFHKYSIITK